MSHAQSDVANGTGDGMLINSGHATGIVWGATNAPTTYVTKGILGLENALPPQYENYAKWYANKNTYSTIRGLVDSQARPLWQQTDAPGLTNYVKGLPATLLGYDVVKSQFLADLGTASNKAMAFGDLRGYYIADRVGISIEVFREVLGLRDLVAVYARKRVGGQLLHPWRVKVMQCAA
jgi:HK97 family phage major capsid protein